MDCANSSRESSRAERSNSIRKKFQPVRFDAPKTFHAQRKTLLGMIGNRQHTTGQIVIFRPQLHLEIIVKCRNTIGRFARTADRLRAR